NLRGHGVPGAGHPTRHAPRPDQSAVPNQHGAAPAGGVFLTATDPPVGDTVIASPGAGVTSAAPCSRNHCCFLWRADSSHHATGCDAAYSVTRTRNLPIPPSLFTFVGTFSSCAVRIPT